MPRLLITCYRDMSHDSNNRPVAAPLAPPLAEAYVDITSESIVSDPFPEYSHFVCLHPDANCAIAFGPDPVADPDYHWIDAGERLFYGVRAGHKVAVIGTGLRANKISKEPHLVLDQDIKNRRIEITDGSEKKIERR